MPLIWILIFCALLLGGIVEYCYKQTRHREVRRRSFSTPPKAIEIDIDKDPLFQSITESPSLAEPYYLVLDTETSRLIQAEEPTPPLLALSWQLYTKEGYKLGEEQSHYVLAPAEIELAASLLHGIKEEDRIRNGLELDTLWHLFKKDLRQCHCLVAHNLAFHLEVLKAFCPEKGIFDELLAEKAQCCTLQWGSLYAPKTGKAYLKLGELFGYLYHGTAKVEYRYQSKTVRDLRLVGAILRHIIKTDLYRPDKSTL